jgi:hypothetical protein
MAYGKLFHLIHMTGDLPALEAWYDDVFDVKRGFLDNHYMEGEIRDASLVTLADAVIEPLAPAFRVDGWDAMPLGKFYTRFGARWQSIAMYCDDTGDVWQACRDNNIRVYVNGGFVAEERPSAAIMTHPKDTVGLLEFCKQEGILLELDPRSKPDFDPNYWRDHHPSTIERLAYTTAITKDLERAKRIYVDELGGTLLHENESELTGTRNAYVALGETVIELALPTVADSFAGRDLAANGEIHHAAAWKVADLGQAEKYLVSKGLQVSYRDDETLLFDPETTHGAYFRFTTWSVPNDPRG